MSLLDKPIARLDGTPSTLSEITGGSAALIVNVASKCGLTQQYTALEELQKKYADRGFTVVGVPCNQFGGQEPGTSEEIATFCSTSFGVSFPLTEKVDVNGDDQHPIFAELNQSTDDRGHTGDVTWNFAKFLVAGDGTLVARFAPVTKPDDTIVLEAIEGLLE